MFVKFVLLVFCFIWIYDLIDNINLPRKEKEAPKEKDIFDHPLLVELGIQRPLEECELEEVEFVPLVWKVKYNERIDNFVTIEIEEKESLPCKVD